jgi:hypothetical protein
MIRFSWDAMAGEGKNEVLPQAFGVGLNLQSAATAQRTPRYAPGVRKNRKPQTPRREAKSGKIK